MRVIGIGRQRGVGESLRRKPVVIVVSPDGRLIEGVDERDLDVVSGLE